MSAAGPAEIRARGPRLGRNKAEPADHCRRAARKAGGTGGGEPSARPAKMTAGEPGQVPECSGQVPGTRAESAASGLVPGERESDADRAITAIYRMQYSSLVRMAAVLVGDVSTAEEVVQDSFIAVHGAWCRLRDIDMAVRHLRRSVVNRSRSVLRHRVTAQHAPRPEPGIPCAQQEPATRQEPAPRQEPAAQQAGPEEQQALERPAVISALRTLPARQREALVLKFYLDLEDKQVASAMGTSLGAVNSYITRAKAALRSVLEET